MKLTNLSYISGTIAWLQVTIFSSQGGFHKGAPLLFCKSRLAWFQTFLYLCTKFFDVREKNFNHGETQ